jgi:hypothetical protein
MHCNKQCGTLECKMWGCQAKAILPEPDSKYLYKVGDIVRHPYSGEIIGEVIECIDRDFVDKKGVTHPHLYQGRMNGKIPGLGKYPSYLLKGLITGNIFPWTQRDERLFADYTEKVKIQYTAWLTNNDNQK